MFSGCTVPPGSKETELGSSNQEASLSEGKKTGVVLVPCSCRLCSLQLFLMVWIFLRSLGLICYRRLVLSEGHKNYFKIGLS